jgi:hypothetical protein
MNRARHLRVVQSLCGEARSLTDSHVSSHVADEVDAEGSFHARSWRFRPRRFGRWSLLAGWLRNRRLRAGFAAESQGGLEPELPN